MTLIDYIALIVIFILASLLGYFLHKALQAQKVRELEAEASKVSEMKDSLAKTERSYDNLKIENAQLKLKEEKLRKDFYDLTLSYKKLQDDFRQKEQELLKKQYDVPPELPRLKESNKLLAKEIKRLRKKIRKFKSRKLTKENKKLRKKLKRRKLELIELQVAQENIEKLEKYEQLYDKLQVLSQEARSLFENEKPIEENIAEIKNPTEENSEIEEAVLPNFFRKQPDFRKKKILAEIMGEEDSLSEDSKAYNLPEEIEDDDDFDEKTILDISGMDSKAFAIFLHAGITEFSELASLKSSKIRKLLIKGGLDPDQYDYASWPIEAEEMME